MTKTTSEPKKMPRKKTAVYESTDGHAHGDANNSTTVDTPDTSKTSAGTETGLPPAEKTSSLASTGAEAPPRKKVARGLASTVSTKQLRDGIWLRTLLLANRFRVIRTIDVAVACFPERPFKAALTAAQRGMRGIVKADLLRRYRTDRFQTVYGLTQKGVDWLDEAGHDAASSVRRVSDMTNPEHRLWAQFWVLCCEARGMPALTEQELLHDLNKDLAPGGKPIQGLLPVTIADGKRTSTLQLRPDAVCRNDGAANSTTWAEIDRSKRGSAREASLGALCSSVGCGLKDGTTLRKIVVFCKTERILKRAVAVVNGLAGVNNSKILTSGRRHFREIESGTFAVWAALEAKLDDGRTELVDKRVGHVIIQLLPIWLPKVRIDASNTHSLDGWFRENYLPYRRPEGTGDWNVPMSPLFASVHKS
ncbi:MAG: hypothetical protein ABI606_10685 [Rhodoferax sp.]